MAGRPLEIDLECCPAYTNANRRLWLRNGMSSYQRCLGCGSIYTSPKVPTEHQYQKLIEKYALSAETIQMGVGRKSSLKLIAKTVQQFIPGGIMLDMGCGTGDFFHYFEPELWQRFGIEISPAAAQYSEKLMGVKVFTDLSETRTFQDGFFDLVTLLDVVYHLGDPHQILVELRRLLSPHGMIGLEIAGLSYMLVRSRGIVCQIVDGKWTRLEPGPPYLNWFSVIGLETLLKRSGFQVIQKKALAGPQTGERTTRLFFQYSRAIGSLARVNPYFLTWSPKVLFLATPTPVHD